MIVTLANNQPAYTRAKPRLRQSDVDREKAWKQSDVREARLNPMADEDRLFWQLRKERAR